MHLTQPVWYRDAEDWLQPRSGLARLLLIAVGALAIWLALFGPAIPTIAYLVYLLMP